MRQPIPLPDVMQRTPHGRVRVVGLQEDSGCTLVAMGPLIAIQWLFPMAAPADITMTASGMARHRFDPTLIPAVFPRHLVRDLATWRLAMNRRLTVWRRQQAELERAAQTAHRLRRRALAVRRGWDAAIAAVETATRGQRRGHPSRTAR